jgi:6,7-dimethyl-8-ribityllumazine synthase
MVKVIEGNFDAKGKRFGIVVARFNEFISKELLTGAIECLERHGAGSDAITVAWVPGSFDLPLAARLLAESGKVDAVICLGAVIRGGTPHFEYVASEAAKGIAQVGMQSGVPAIFGLLTTDTIEQAVERAGTKAGNKGFDAALAAIEMVDLAANLKK